MPSWLRDLSGFQNGADKAQLIHMEFLAPQGGMCLMGVKVIVTLDELVLIAVQNAVLMMITM